MKRRIAHNAGKLLLRMAVWVVVAGPTLIAQNSTVPVTDKTAPVFEVVSIKPDDGSSQYHAFHPTPTGYVASNTPLDRVIRQSYLGLLVTPDERLKGAPSWVLNTPYDI
ncbi:MAG TPA: hypothetical protein VGU23_02690, partial [Acidobacteriaceae bacterium]|nr:hypothetical protein [Acidobacteriaceae bacterium]